MIEPYCKCIRAWNFPCAMMLDFEFHSFIMCKAIQIYYFFVSFEKFFFFFFWWSGSFLLSCLIYWHAFVCDITYCILNIYKMSSDIFFPSSSISFIYLFKESTFSISLFLFYSLVLFHWFLLQSLFTST